MNKIFTAKLNDLTSAKTKISKPVFVETKIGQKFLALGIVLLSTHFMHSKRSNGKT
jgi:hypothetical protein